MGARFHGVSRHGRTVDLNLTEIRRYPEASVAEVDPPHAARVLLAGTGARDVRLEAGDILKENNPAT
ncbi:hypothetical protein [Streptomyces sp. NPDC060027]|uniref:hypothetical protein n=1 Tax=Streptomyces sp. NPDC060027 TaxID=3347040 RepID=UPI00369E0DB7